MESPPNRQVHQVLGDMAEPHDYLYFCCGLVCFAIPVVLRWQDRTATALPWAWLAWFGLLQGCHAWLEVVAMDLSDTPLFAWGRLVVLVLSLGALLEFGRRGLGRFGVRVAAWWAYAPLLAGLAFARPGSLDACFAVGRFALGLSAGALAAWAFWRYGSCPSVGRAWFRRIIGAVLLLQGCFCAMPKTPLASSPWPLKVLNRATLEATVGLPLPAVSLVCVAIGVVVGWWMRRRVDRPAAEQRRLAIPLVAPLVLLVAGGGWVVVTWSTSVLDGAMRRELLTYATALASTIDSQHIKNLSFTAADRERIEFVRLRGQMRAYQELLPCLGIYTLAVRDGRLRFGPESYAEDDPMASPPGTVFQCPSPELCSMFYKGQALVEGPQADEYGNFVSALAPIRDRRTGRVLAVVGLDIDATEWCGRLAEKRLIVIGFAAVLVTLLVGGALLVRWRNIHFETPGWWQHTEAFSVAAIGLTATLFAVLAVHEQSFRLRHAGFTQLADAQAHRLSESIIHLGENQLASVANFMEARQEATQKEFRVFAEDILPENAFQAIGWIVPVPAGEVPALETHLAAKWGRPLPLWQRDANERHVPLTARPVYYPIVLSTPAIYDASVGFDVGSEARRRAALETAIATGLPTATDPIRLDYTRGPSSGILVMQPVFCDRERKRLQGIVLALLQPHWSLRSILFAGPAIDKAVAVEMYQIEPGQSPRLLASSANDSEEAAPRDLRVVLNHSYLLEGVMSNTYPLFAFGKTYVLVVRAPHASLLGLASSFTWVTLLAGLALTALMTALTSFLSRRSAQLETQVCTRTSELTERIERYDLLVTRYQIEQEKLRESESMQRTLLDSLTAGVVIVDANTHVIERVNPAAARFFGAPGNQIIGHVCHQFLCPSEKGACPISDLGQELDNADRVMIRADGSRLPILKTVTRINLDGREKLLESFIDISARIRAEQALRESQGRLAATLHSIGDGVISTDVLGRVTSLNAVAETLTGWANADACGRPVADIFHVVRQTPGEELESDIRRTLNDGLITTLPDHTSLVSRDGARRQIATSCSPIRNPDGAILGAVLVFRDVTEEYCRIQELRESRERFAQISEVSREVIWEVDPEGRYTYISRECLPVFGFSEDEVIGRLHFYDLHPEEGREAFRAEILAVFRRNEPFVDYQSPVIAKDGRIVEVLTNGVPILDEEGRLLGYRGSNRDITEQRRNEEQLRNYAAALEKANRTLEELNRSAQAATRAKSEFLANMSHEIRTPMSAILGYVQLLLSEQGLDRAPPHRIEALRTIERNGQYLLALINDILDLSKIEAGKFQTERIACSPAELLAEVVGLMQVRADAQKLPLRLEFATPIPATIHSDPTRLRQILVNLVGNAVKFTSKGEVRLVARLVEPPGQSRPNLAFDVIDTGIGMSDDQIQRLFQPFNQADSSTSRTFGGTGLGLAICKRLAEMLGGEISVVSALGRGSTFTLSLAIDPFDPEAVVTRPIADSGRNAAGGRLPPLQNQVLRAENASDAQPAPRRVLLAEDTPDLQALASALLVAAGAAVTAVENGEQAVRAVMAAAGDGHPFDIVLMDMQMPVLDGYEATRRLRAEGYPGPIVALTAHAMAGDRQKCLQAGCDGYLSKPIDPDALAAVLGELPPSERHAVSEYTAPEPLHLAGEQESDEILVSEYADRPAIARILGTFVQRLTERAAAMQSALEREDCEELKRLAHQLKGAAGSYGYPSLSVAAKDLQEQVEQGQWRQAADTMCRIASLAKAVHRGLAPALSPNA